MFENFFLITEPCVVPFDLNLCFVLSRYVCECVWADVKIYFGRTAERMTRKETHHFRD